MGNKTKHTAVVTVVFKGVAPFLSDFFSSINNQTNKDFDLIVFNHDASQDELIKIPDDANVVNVPNKFSPIAVRSFAFEYVLNHQYKNVIIADSDDWLADNRVETTKFLLNKFDFVFNELVSVNQNSTIIENNIIESLKINTDFVTVDSVLDYNFVGMGNSGLCLKNFKTLNLLPFPEYLITLDWFLYSVLLLNKLSYKFCNDTYTFYRQHNNNLVGLNNLLTEEKLKKGILAKSNHYKAMADYCKYNNINGEKIYEKKIIEMSQLHEEVQEYTFRMKYLNVVNKNYKKIYKGWWSEILPLEEWRKYE